MRVFVWLFGAVVTAVVFTGSVAQAENSVLPCNSFCQSWMGFNKSETRRIEETPADQTTQPAPAAVEASPQETDPPAAPSKAKRKLKASRDKPQRIVQPEPAAQSEVQTADQPATGAEQGTVDNGPPSEPLGERVGPPIGRQTAAGDRRRWTEERQTSSTERGTDGQPAPAEWQRRDRRPSVATKAETPDTTASTVPVPRPSPVKKLPPRTVRAAEVASARAARKPEVVVLPPARPRISVAVAARNSSVKELVVKPALAAAAVPAPAVVAPAPRAAAVQTPQPLVVVPSPPRNAEIPPAIAVEVAAVPVLPPPPPVPVATVLPQPAPSSEVVRLPEPSPQAVAAPPPAPVEAAPASLDAAATDPQSAAPASPAAPALPAGAPVTSEPAAPATDVAETSPAAPVRDSDGAGMSAKAAVDPAPQSTEQATVAAPSLPQAASAAQVPPAAEPETPPSKIVEVAPVLPAAEPKTVPARTVAVAPALPPVQPEPAPAQTVSEGTALPAAKLEPAVPQTVAAVPALPVKPETVPPASVVPPSAGVAAEVPRPLSADSMASRVLTPAPTEPPRASTAQATAPATPVPAPAPKPAPTAEAPAPAKPTSTVLASAEPGRPDASPVGGTNAAAPLADGLSVLAARVALETEMLRGSQSNPGYAACVGDQIGALTASTPASELAPAALAQRVFGTCAKPAPERGAAAARPAMSVTAFKAAIANAGSDGAEVLTSVLQSQVAFRLQTDKHLYRCINDGYLAKIGPAAKRPLMFRALLASLNGFSSEDYSLAGVIATSLQAFCADEQFELTVQK